MRLRLTRTAAIQLDHVLDYIAQISPSGAAKVQSRILAVTQLLLQHPYAGQKTGRENIRRMVASPYPYILTYRIADGEIVIRSIRHAARRPIAG